jgi:hypothetical protein
MAAGGVGLLTQLRTLHACPLAAARLRYIYVFYVICPAFQEGSMDSKTNNANGPDTMGLWFAALVICAVLAAGVIVYQTGNSDIVTASNEATPAVTHGSAH